jgi:hypothetical protein
MVITYQGTRSGTAYLRVVSDDGGRSYSMTGSFPSIQVLQLVMNGGTTCTVGGDAMDIPLTAGAWIDVSGNEAANCSDVRSPQCQPAPADPQAHQKAVLRFGELTRIRLDLVGPP